MLTIGVRGTDVTRTTEVVMGPYLETDVCYDMQNSCMEIVEHGTGKTPILRTDI